MKLDSKYFDMIRIQPRRSGERRREAESAVVTCQWKDCGAPGHHRAPKGRGRDGEHYWFCREHVRQYNASYNYFDGMSDNEIEQFRNDAIYGHRPTWKMGTDGAEPSAANGNASPSFGATARNFHSWRAKQARNEASEQRRQLKPLEKKSLEALGLSGAPAKGEIKSRFKELVKRHHPDSNGGDRASEEKLREIIQAYNYLKQVGLV
jgi:hypothetical protein